MSLNRFQELVAAADDSAKDVRTKSKPGRLFAIGHDVRQLLEAARLQQPRDHATEAGDRRTRGAELVPPILG